MTEEIKNELTIMQSTIREKNKQPVFFIGSGISRRYLASPDWTSLLKEIAGMADCDFDKFEKLYGQNNEKIAQELEYYFFRKATTEQIQKKQRRVLLRDAIAAIVTQNKIQSEYEDEIRALRKTRPEAIITTNYDTLLEEIFGNDYTVHIGQSAIISNDISEAGDLYKIHGCVSAPDSIVITKEDYDEFFRSSKYLYAKLLTMFWEYPLVFMGYSISDRNIKDILTSIVEIMSDIQLKDFSSRIWVLGYTKHEESVTRKKIELFNNKSIEVTYFEMRNYVDFFESISLVTSNQQFGNLKFSISEDVIELLIKPLYEKQDNLKVVTRELLQNALDACKKKKVNADIKISYIKEDKDCFLVIKDNGIGMNLQEVRKNFLTVGKTNKKDSEEGLVGKYGVGILSIFLLGEYAEVFTKKIDTNQIAFKVYIHDDKKQVSWLDSNEIKNDENEESYTIIRVKIADTDKVDTDNKIDTFIKLLGLDGYITNNYNTITIYFNQQSKELIKINDKEWFYCINDEISLYKANWSDIDEEEKSPEEKKLLNILKQNDVVFFNDMISYVSYNKSNYKQLDGINIPFLIINIKNMREKEKDFKTELSRNSVEITGDLMKTIARGIYTLEIDKALEIIFDTQKLIDSGNSTIFELKNKLQRETSIFGRKCDLLIENNKLLITTNWYLAHIEIWGNEKVGNSVIKNIEKEKALYSNYNLHKTSIADFITKSCIIGISIRYLDDYISNATGPQNGFKIAALKKVLEFLNMPNTSNLQSSNELWGYVKSNKTEIRQNYLRKSINGILWFKDEYRKETFNENINDYFIVFESSSISKYIDLEFYNILKEKIDLRPELRDIITI